MQNTAKQNYPGLVASYDTRPGNKVSLFYNAPELTQDAPVIRLSYIHYTFSINIHTWRPLAMEPIRSSTEQHWMLVRHNIKQWTAQQTVQYRLELTAEGHCHAVFEIMYATKQSKAKQSHFVRCKAKSHFVWFDRLLCWRVKTLRVTVDSSRKILRFLRRKNEENAKTCLLKFGKCKKNVTNYQMMHSAYNSNWHITVIANSFSVSLDIHMHCMHNFMHFC